MSRVYFGTDGVRGPVNGPLINEAFAARLAQAAAAWVGGSGRVLIGRDTRASGALLAAAVARGVAAAGLEPVLLGVVPTPAVARAVRREGAVLGVVITASHNPASDNGIKFFNRHGLKLSDADEERIESLLPAEPASPALRTWATADVCEDYVKAATGLLPAGALTGWSIVLDTAHGATFATSAQTLRALGAHVVAIGDQPDGLNINAEVGSEHPQPLAAKVRETGARLGIAHDGDGDRCVVCDERGDVLDGDELLTILALQAKRRGSLAKDLLVATVQSNLGVDAALAAAGIRVARTAVGDRYVVERMRADGAVLGGESSGHVVCFDVSPTGDGLVAALKLIDAMLATGQPLSALRRALRKFPQAQKALKVAAKRPLAECPTLLAAITALEDELGAHGRVLVRFSGTEAKLRLLVEGPDDTAAQAGVARLEAAARADLQVI